MEPRDRVHRLYCSQGQRVLEAQNTNHIHDVVREPARRRYVAHARDEAEFGYHASAVVLKLRFARWPQSGSEFSTNHPKQLHCLRRLGNNLAQDENCSPENRK